MYGISISLPSRGKYGKSSVEIRRPKLYDILDYLQAGDNGVASKNALIRDLCDTDLSKYPEGDREYIFVTLRTLIRDAVITGTFPCEQKGCNDIVVYSLNLQNCKVNQLPDDFISGYELEFPICGVKKKLNLVTVEKGALLEEYTRFYETADNGLLHTDLGENLHELARYACMFEDTKSLQDIDANITLMRNDFDWTDFEILMAYDLAFQCGPEVVSDTKCDNCKTKYKVNIKTDSSFFGLSIEGLVRKHKFLAKMANIGFKDFMEYTVPVMNTVVEDEIQAVKEHNEKIRKIRSTNK